jgi:hypothetical protein
MAAPYRARALRAPVCAIKEWGHFLYGAATPPVSGGEFSRRRIFAAITRLSQFAGLILVIGIGTHPVEAHKPITSKYTYTEDVFPIFNERCGRCHVAGGVAPMSLLTYKDAFPWAESIRVELTAAHMPPWFADIGNAELKNSHRLSPRELDIILTWASGGTPEGPSKRLTPTANKNEWKMGKPSLVLPLPAAITLDAEKSEDTREIVLAAAPDADRWVKAVDLLPGAPAIVRDALIYTKSPSGNTSVLGVWFPADEPIAAPTGAAYRWPAGSDLVLKIHYRKTWTYDGKPVTDRSTVGVYLSDRPPDREVHSIEVAAPLTLERNASALAIRIEGTVPDKSLRVEAVRPDGTMEPLIALLSRPDWSRRYWFSRVVSLPKGTRIQVAGAAGAKAYLEVTESQ